MAKPNVTLQVGPGSRGGYEQTVATFGGIQRMDLSWSWGAQPATAIVVYPGAAILQNSEVRLIVPITNAPDGTPIAPGTFSTFYGICKKISATNSSAGALNTFEFVDNREFLYWDIVRGWFNVRQDMLVNGLWTKRYMHLLPINFESNLITYTTDAYSAAEILTFLFTAPTVTTYWNPYYHVVQSDPVYNVDCSQGRKLADVITEISNRQGLVFALLGDAWDLQWVIKGEGNIPLFPLNSDDRRVGEALSGNPSNVTIMGGRNRYQVLNIPMQADWNATLLGAFGGDYVNFESNLVDYVFNNMTDPLSGRRYNVAPGGDAQNVTGYMLAKARAETLTVGEFADFCDSLAPGSGEPFRDHRKFNGRTRLDMPVMIYTRLLVYRAYMLPSNFQIVTITGQILGPLNCKIVPMNLAEINYDYVTGKMTSSATQIPGGNGLAIVQGFRFFTPPPTTFRSDQFNFAAWQNTQQLWQKVPFQIDDTGDQTQFIIFDEPVAVSNNLLTTIDGHGVLNANATFTAPPVLAALTFEAETFTYYEGVEGISEPVPVPDLSADYTVNFLGSPTGEIPYADGQTAEQKAAAIAASLLLQQPVYVLGGYINRGCNGTQLSGTVDRINMTLDDKKGLLETVDFTTERSRDTFEPERDFERRLGLIQLAPGQAELRTDSREIWQTVAALRHSPTFMRLMIQAFHERYGTGSRITQVQVDL